MPKINFDLENFDLENFDDTLDADDYYVTRRREMVTRRRSFRDDDFDRRENAQRHKRQKPRRINKHEFNTDD